MRHGNAAVCHHDHQSRKLSLNHVYQLTHKTRICRSKCRPLNRSAIGTNRCISSSSPATLAVAPEFFQGAMDTDGADVAWSRVLPPSLRESFKSGLEARSAGA